MNIDVIKNVIRINKFFEAKGKTSVDVTGYGNIQSAYSHVIVTKRDNKYYIDCYVTNEWGKTYRPFGTSTIIIDSLTGEYTCEVEIREHGKIYEYIYTNHISLPAYFSETADKYVEELVDLLSRKD